MSTRILLVDDHQIMREGLRALLEKLPDVRVVAEADNGRTAVRLARELSPDIVIIDVAMPEMNGIEATRQIKTDAPGIKVIALSMHADKPFVIEMLKVGAGGYLIKDSAFDELANAIRVVMSGQLYVSPPLAEVMIKDYLQQVPSETNSAYTILTAREREVLQLLAEGCSSKQIATQLDLSVKTVEAYRQQIMDKLNLHSVAELTKYAIREGLTPLET